MNFSPSYQRGQVLLIIILVMVVALTIGLSVVSRSIVNLRTTEEEENSQKAFSAAEAGIERLINSSAESLTLSDEVGTDASFNAKITSYAKNSNSFLVYNYNLIPKDDGADIWLSNYPTYTSPLNAQVTVYWGSPSDTCTNNESTNTESALQIVVISGDINSPQNLAMTHYMLEPCSSRASVNNFSQNIQSGGVIGGKQFTHSYTVSVTNGLLMRIIPLYAPTRLGISSTQPLPAQGQIIESTGVVANTERKLTVYKGYPTLPVEIFPHGIFSP